MSVERSDAAFMQATILLRPFDASSKLNFQNVGEHCDRMRRGKGENELPSCTEEAAVVRDRLLCCAGQQFAGLQELRDGVWLYGLSLIPRRFFAHVVRNSANHGHQDSRDILL